MFKRPIPLIVLVLTLLTTVVSSIAEYVWFEAETAANMNVTPNVSGWGNSQFMSGDKWMQIQFDADKVDAAAPADGVLLKYNFAVKNDGTYEIWNRVGYEYVRPNFYCRVDDGEWVKQSSESLTIDLMSISEWCEIAWLKMTTKQLTAGNHTLEIKIEKEKDEKGKTKRILYSSDVLCISSEPFYPNSKYKPDENYRTPQDEEASKNIFNLPKAVNAVDRLSINLNGQWEVCRHDEYMPADVATPIKELPEKQYWTAIAVPGDKNVQRLDLRYAHRLWYRTRINVPAESSGHSYFLTFPQNNLNTTVYVNGLLCGFNKNCFASFTIDVSKAIKPGVNEVWVGIRDVWYGNASNPNNPMVLRKTFNYPYSWSNRGFLNLAYPVWNHFQSGILVTPTFTAAGNPAYVSDVFAKPSVSKKLMEAEVTVNNTTAKDVSGELQWSAIDQKTGKLEKTFAVQPFTVVANTEKVLKISDAWANPNLWWPDAPNMYWLRTSLVVNGKTVDIANTSFGFREWTSEGIDFKLNGITWHGWADCHTANNADQWLTNYRKSNQTVMRFWGTSWQGMDSEKALDFFDKNGVVCRRTGILDGETIGYMAIENDPDLKKLYNSDIKMDLQLNWRDQMVAMVKGERNHPSVMIWSIENEFLFINCINLYGGLMDKFEAETTKTSDAIRAVDPTRFVMVDGGGATKAQTLPVHGDHYTTGNVWQYPTLAYENNTKGGGRGRWEWDMTRPRFIGEELYATGINPMYAYFGGENVFLGKEGNRPAVGIFDNILTQGYRWTGVGAWHYWQGQNDASDQYKSNALRAVFSRQWNWTFYSGEKVTRTFGIFNDTRYADPITFTWTLTVGGKKVATDSKVYNVEPGKNVKFDTVITMPQVTARQEGELTLVLTVKGAEIFRDVKAVSVMNTTTKPANVNKLKASDILVYDPYNSVVDFLTLGAIPFTTLKDLADLSPTAKLLIIGKDALDAKDSTSSKFSAFATNGKAVIILDQKNPLRYQGLPAEMRADSNEGRTAFGEDLTHPVLKGILQKDFFTWSGDEIVYKSAYSKPDRGAKSLVQCHSELKYTGLAEVPVGDGVMLLSQLVIGEKLASSAPAQQLLMNMIDYGATYKLEFRNVVAAVADNPKLSGILNGIGLQYKTVNSPLNAIQGSNETAVIPATPENLKLLADNLPAIKAFNDKGGWMIFIGLTPEGLADYNKIVGVDHIIRPFVREKVTFSSPKNPLTAGLTLPDVALYAAEKVFSWTDGYFINHDTFSYVVDYDEVASFAKFDNSFNQMMTNGMTSADAWKYIVNVPAPVTPPLDFTMTLPREEELTRVDWNGNTFYYPVTKFQLLDKGTPKASFDVLPNTDTQSFDINPSVKVKDLSLRLAAWDIIPGKGAYTGLDNIRLYAKRSPDFYAKVKPMLNIGGLMSYPKGNGGIILCNINFKDTEEVPVNIVKKRTVLASFLRNLKAPFAGSKNIIAGANMDYQPIDISKFANQYIDERGAFGDNAFTLKDMPLGKQRLAGVTYNLYEFATSPVPTIIMLGGNRVPNKLANEVKGIPVNRKADALFFLQTARLDSRRNPNEIKQNKIFDMAKYVITYADGKTVEVPINTEVDVENYKQTTPTAIPGAQIAWSKQYADGTYAVLYSMQWNNPRPDADITSVDLIYGSAKRGIPALIAITAATVVK